MPHGETDEGPARPQQGRALCCAPGACTGPASLRDARFRGRWYQAQGRVGAGAEEAGKRGGREKAGTKGQAGESQGQRIQKPHEDRKDGWD